MQRFLESHRLRGPGSITTGFLAKEPGARCGSAPPIAHLGVPGPLAEIYADRIDWNQVARLVVCDCPPRLAPRTVR